MGINMKSALMASASVPVSAIPEAFEPLGWYGEVDAGWHVLNAWPNGITIEIQAKETPCQPFNAHEAMTRACVDQYGIPAAMFDRWTDQKTNTVTAGEDRMAFWETVLGQPYQIDMTLRGAERIDLNPDLHAGL